MTSELAGLSHEDLVRAMVGRDLEEHVPTEKNIRGTVLQVERLTREGVFTDVSFDVHAGEIVALAGLVGAGRSEVACAIFGVDRFDGGAVSVNGTKLRSGSPSAAMDAGIGLVPEDRRQQGLVMDMSIARNIALASLKALRRLGFISGAAERRFARDWATRLQVKYGNLSDPMTSLSGGNQQKVVIAREVSGNPDALIAAQPTRGLDVGAIEFVHRRLLAERDAGRAILLFSLELDEVRALADRILVIYEGRIVGELPSTASDEELGLLMTGSGTRA
jgi:rhamnose transport system ATP-binding protein